MAKTKSPDETTEELQAKANDARSKASHSLDKLAAEMQPKALIERTIDELTHQAADKLHQAQTKVADKLTRSVQRNAWPAILIGAAILYFLSRTNNSKH